MGTFCTLGNDLISLQMHEKFQEEEPQILLGETNDGGQNEMISLMGKLEESDCGVILIVNT